MMKSTRGLWVCVLAVAGGVLAAVVAADQSAERKKDEAAIRGVIQLYFDGRERFERFLISKSTSRLLFIRK